MDQHADLGSFFSHYLLERFRQRYGDTGDGRIEDWHGGTEARSTLHTGGSGLNLLIEFKPDEAGWAAEFGTPARRRWCQRLSDVPSMQRVADVCHFVAWDTGDMARVGALLAFYSKACTPGLMLRGREARAHSQPHAVFVHSLLERQTGASDRGFQEYLRFVAPIVVQETAESQNPQLRILWLHIWDASLQGYWLDGFASLANLGEWLAKDV